jgi:aconitate hydratase
MNDPLNTLKSIGNDNKRFYYSLPALEEQGVGGISRLPVSIRIMLESVMRHVDGEKITEENVKELANWNAENPGTGEVPFVVSRVILQDFTGVPLLVDLAAMRDAVAEAGFDPKIIEPLVPVDLVVDHSVQVDRFGTEDSFMFNLETEFNRNRERYEFLKWGQQAFETFKVVPPGVGIVHQVNLEHIGTVVVEKEVDGSYLYYPDTLVGTDSHTTMINGLGIVGWGVGGIEAEAAMLGQPVFIQMPEVIGVHFTGKLPEGATATDLTLRVTEILREENVVGKFVEYFGEGAASLTVADRATMANMSPEYGATIGFFPADEKTLDYMRMTGRSSEHVKMVEDYLKEQGLFGIPKMGDVDYTKVIELDLSTVKPCVAGPKRPQDRMDLTAVKSKFLSLLEQSPDKGGYGKSAEEVKHKVRVAASGEFHLETAHETGGKPELQEEDHYPSWSESEMVSNRPVTKAVAEPGYQQRLAGDFDLSHGSVVIAAITSCTNTSNPSVMLGAGLLAKKAVEKGLSVHPEVKTSLAPGSRVVTDYFEKTGLQKYLNDLGFDLVAYGCTTCIGNSGPLQEDIENAIKEHDIITTSVLSGNRNFEARIHGTVKANFLMSPPLVVAYAIAGRIDIDFEKEPLGKDKEGSPVYLKDIWPSGEEIQKTVSEGIAPEMYKERYANISKENPIWKKISVEETAQYNWQPSSTYIRRPPYFDEFSLDVPKSKEMKNMRPLALFGDSVTTDHISPAGAFSKNTPAGQYLVSKGVDVSDFNSYGSRRGNHEVMMRGTFSNVRIRNLMAGGREGGYTKLMPEGETMAIYDAAEEYKLKNTPLIVFAGKDYGMGSSRDWAAKGAALLGVNVVVAESFERIHRSNLIGMGVLPLVFTGGDSWKSLGITGEETFSIEGLENPIKPGQEAELKIESGGETRTATLKVRLDTPIEVNYYRHGGIMPYVLRKLIPA